MKPEDKKVPVEGTDEFPGAAVDVADNEKVTEEAVKSAVKELNNNPRNSLFNCKAE